MYIILLIKLIVEGFLAFDIVRPIKNFLYCFWLQYEANWRHRVFTDHLQYQPFTNHSPAIMTRLDFFQTLSLSLCQEVSIVSALG